MVNLRERTRGLALRQEFESLTPESRSHERYKRVGLSALASIAAKAVSLATTLVSLPLTLHYLGNEQYGLWVTITSLAALLGFANLGLGNGLINGMSETLGKNDRVRAAEYVSSAFFMLIGITVLLSVAFAACYAVVPWAEAFNVDSSDGRAVAGPAVGVFVVLTLVGLPLGVIAGVRSGLQEGFANSIRNAVGSLVSLLGLLIAIAVDVNLPWLVLALGIGPLVGTVLNGVTLFWRRPWLRPSVKRATRRAGARMIRFGLLFFVLSIAGAVAYQTDNIVIAQLLGPAEVTQYAVPMRLFLLAPLLLSFALVPLWPAYGEALARGDHAWVRQTFARSLGVSATLGALMATGLFLLGEPILHAWVGESINPSDSLLSALAVLTLLGCVTGPIAMYLNGANVLGFQVACAITMMVANLGLSITLTRAIGLSGPAWGSAIAQVVFVLLPFAVYMRSRLRRLSAIPGQ
jgi:O-antigen/teichoic acid export membrane protein